MEVIAFTISGFVALGLLFLGLKTIIEYATGEKIYED